MSASDSPPASGDRPEESSRRDSPAIWHPAREWLEEDENEDDMDYEPESETSENTEDRAHLENHIPGDDDEEDFFGVHLNYFGIVLPLVYIAAYH
jgi:WD repeat-containing protein 23